MSPFEQVPSFERTPSSEQVISSIKENGFTEEVRELLGAWIDEQQRLVEQESIKHVDFLIQLADIYHDSGHFEMALEAYADAREYATQVEDEDAASRILQKMLTIRGLA